MQKLQPAFEARFAAALEVVIAAVSLGLRPQASLCRSLFVLAARGRGQIERKEERRENGERKRERK